MHVYWLLQTTNGGSTWTTVYSLPGGRRPDLRPLPQRKPGLGRRRRRLGDERRRHELDRGRRERGVSAIAATDASHVWAFGDGIVSTVDGPNGDTAPPQTLDDADWGWHRARHDHPEPSDTGGSGLADHAVLDRRRHDLADGTSIAVPAPADHANDGLHTFLYRSTDNAGNIEATEICGVGIDTLGPACGAPKEPVAGTGKSAIVRFKASDATSGVAVATIKIETRSGRVLETLVTRPGNWSYEPRPALLLAAFHLQTEARPLPGRGRCSGLRRQQPGDHRPQLAAGAQDRAQGQGARLAVGPAEQRSGRRRSGHRRAASCSHHPAGTPPGALGDMAGGGCEALTAGASRRHFHDLH